MKQSFYHRISIFLGTFLIPLLLHAQVIDRRYLDSIIPILTNNKNDVAVIQLADSICYTIRSNSPNEADNLYEYFDQNARDDRLTMVISYRWGPMLASIGEVEKSYYTRHKTLRLAKKLENEDYLVNAYNSLTRYFIGIVAADSAAYYNHQMEALITKNPKEQGDLLWDVYYMKGEIQKLLGNNKKQGAYYEKAWELMKESSDKKQQGFFLYILTEHFQQEKNIEKQSYYGNLFVEYNIKKGLSTPNYHFPVEALFLKNDSPEELQQLKEVIESSKEQNNLSAYAATVVILAESYLKNDLAEKAIPYLEDLIQKLDSANYPYNYTRDRDLLQEAYASGGNYEAAYRKLQDFKNMSDSISNQEVLSKIANFEVKYETKKKEAEIEKQAAAQKLLYWIVGSIALLLGLVTIFLLKNQKKNKLLDKQKRMLEVTVDEKNVLLKETHHRVKNSFQIVSSLLYLQAETIQDKEAQLAMKEAQNRVRSMVLIHQRLYSKGQLVGINTEEYITDLAQDIFESHQTETEQITYQLDIVPLVLDIETITPLGLIINELITNVIKHAFPASTNLNKKLLAVSLVKKEEQLILTVADNGVGMPDRIKESSFGISLIKSLAKKLKATISYPSNEGSGTKVEVVCHRFSEL